MKKDIPQHKVAELAIAIVPREEDIFAEDGLWDVFVINFREQPIHNVLVNSRGYGEIEGEIQKTTILRHYFEEMGPRKAYHIEPIHTKLFAIANEFWVSFTFNDYMYDKKYVFVKGSITRDNFTKIPMLDRKGVMIR
ncbi:MAG: hypothetical protein EPO28_18100 [Saprospiraceae bacterium]|nr:MAG: hypothetical protein EPO28_18100 [Saprospiraceae bacterium]